MAEKLGMGGHGSENYDPNTGRYVETYTAEDIGSLPDKDIEDYIKEHFPGRMEKIMALNEETRKKMYEELGKSLEKKIELDKQRIQDIDSRDFSESAKEAAKTYNISLIQGEHSLEQDLKAVNLENYNKGETYQRNCVRCGLAFALRRIYGFDVEANERQTGWDRFANGGGWKKLFNNGEAVKPRESNTKVGTFENMTSELDRYPEGSVFIIRVGYTQYSGHVFNAVKENGKVKYIDAQDGTDWDNQSQEYNESFIRKCRKDGFRYMRVDNLEPDWDFIYKENKNDPGVLNKRRSD